MTNKRLYIKADISDWRDEAFQVELLPKTDDDILEAIESGKHTAQIARCTIVSREVGEADKEILPENKLLIMAGAMQGISKKVRNQKIDIETANGQIWRIPAFLGHPNGDDDDVSYVSVDSQKAREWATNYLETIVIGHIRNRLATLYQNGGDITESAEKLKMKIDEMVAELTEPTSR